MEEFQTLYTLEMSKRKIFIFAMDFLYTLAPYSLSSSSSQHYGIHSIFMFSIHRMTKTKPGEI